ncbi:hypothetical protein [Amycolatopsis sp. lyj-109]|uniref:hypothetical protein n=1 Tax=Amycolatopsis sp. lyj-109 TaxID=2789287 RepID=UPI003979CCA6
MTDPRLRLLGTADESAAGELLGALDDVRVEIRAGTDVIGGTATALAAFTGMAARLFGDIAFAHPVALPPNWWGTRDSAALLAALDYVSPHPAHAPQRNLVVTFGIQVEAGDLGVGGDDYTVRLGLTPQPVAAVTTHALGVHAAACLAVSQLLIRVLGPLGFSGVAVDAPYVTNLIDYGLTAAPEIPVLPPVRDRLKLAVAGVGSVGTSSLALLATAFAPQLTGMLSADALEDITVIDSDIFDPTRNPFRYPALLGTETGPKADYMASKLTKLGLGTRPVSTSVADWVVSRENPGFDGLVLSSVDTLTGRLEVTDVLARSALSLGVSGLSLHAQREGFGDGFACPFCDFVSAQPPATQAGVYAETTGLSVQRVLALLQDGAQLTAADIDQAIAAGKLPVHRRGALVGRSINDLVRQAYAEAEVRMGAAAGGEEVVAVAAPQVSWFAGVLAAAEIVKQIHGLAVLAGRVDVDLSGLPPGLVRRVPADRTGRCLCRSGTRRRWYQQLYGVQVPVEVTHGAS